MTACNVKTRLGSACSATGCPKTEHIVCKNVHQQRPADCAKNDAGAFACDEAGVPTDDVLACEDCRQRIIDLQVGETAMAGCACAHCAVPVAACFASGDAQRDEDCRKLVVCGWARPCAGSACYCGDANAQACYKSANGPCAELILQISGCADTACVEAQRTKVGTALNLANQVAKCVTGDPLFPDPTITPMCPLTMFVTESVTRH